MEIPYILTTANSLFALGLNIHSILSKTVPVSIKLAIAELSKTLIG